MIEMKWHREWRNSMGRMGREISLEEEEKREQNTMGK